MTDGDAKSGAAPAQPGSAATPDQTTLIAFGAFIILGGGASTAIRFTYGELAPYWSGVLRFGAAHRLESLRRRRIVGGLLAVVGTAVSGSLSAGVEVSLPHILAILAAAACFAEAGIVAKLFPRNHPYATNAVGMTVGVIMLAAASLIRGETWALPSNADTWLAMVYIILGATVAGFLLYLFILGRWTASGTSYGFVLIPIVTVVLASLVTDETISLFFLVGAAVVLAGVYVGALMPAKKPAEAPVVPEETEPAEEDDIQVRPGLPTCV